LQIANAIRGSANESSTASFDLGDASLFAAKPPPSEETLEESLKNSIHAPPSLKAPPPDPDFSIDFSDVDSDTETGTNMKDAVKRIKVDLKPPEETSDDDF
jgi:hypothetical protein